MHTSASRGRLARNAPYLLLVPALLLACHASAQESADAVAARSAAGQATDLDAVQVNAYRPATSTSGATKTHTPLAETPQSVSVIEREELDARGVQNLNDAMRYVAGVSLESSGIDNRVDDFRIRGFDAGSWSNNVTVDGMRAPQGSQWNRTMVDSWNLDRVEVLKGPSAVMYGQVAPGGMVNQVSKTPAPGLAPQLQVSLDGHGQYGAAFDVGGGSADDRALWRLVGLYRDGQTQIRHTEQEHWFLAPSFTWQFAERTRLTLLGLYQQDDGGSTYQFLPEVGTLRPSPYGYMKNSTFIGDPGWNTWNRDIWTAGWLFEHGFNEHWKLSQSLRHTHVESLFRTVVTNGGLGADGRTQARRATYGTGDSDGETVDTRLEGRFATGAAEHTVLAGWDWQKADWEGARGNMAPPANIDIFEPVYVPYVPQVIGVGLSRGINRQSGAYLQDQVALGGWRLTVGGRYDWTKDDTASANQNAAGATGPWTRTVLKHEAFTGRAGLLYVFENGFTPYVSFAESFQPSTADINQSFDRTPFDPITGRQWEAGLKYQPAGFDGLVTLSAYDLRQQNILTTDPDPTHQNACGATGAGQCMVQDGEGRVRGVELEGRITPAPGFSVIGAATWMDSETTRSNTGNLGKDLVMVPDYTASIWADYTFQAGGLEGLSLALGARYNGESYGDSANAYMIPSYSLFDAAIRYDLGQVGASRLRLALNASNLADKRFVSTCTGPSSCFYGTGRTLVATARWSW